MQQLNIAHEAEVQRQHVRLQLPASVEIGGNRFETIDWSNGGVCIDYPSEEEMNASGAKIEIGNILNGKLGFAFDGFDFSVPMEMEVRYIDRARKRVGCRFINLDKRRLSLLQFMVSSYISGELVSAGDLIDVAGRNNFTVKRKIPAAEEGLSPYQRLQRRMGKTASGGLVVVVTLLLLVYLGASVYERAFVIKASTAVVTADLLPVIATSGGRLTYLNLPPDSKVRAGQPLATILSESGNLVSIDSPCDCYVKEKLFDNGTRAREGDAILKLASLDARPYIQAYVPFEDSLRVAIGQEIMLSYAGDSTYRKGTVTDILARGQDLNGKAVIIIDPEEKLSVEAIDDPVEVRIDTRKGKEAAR